MLGVAGLAFDRFPVISFRLFGGLGADAWKLVAIANGAGASRAVLAVGIDSSEPLAAYGRGR
jgi:hypothetical protein